MSEVVLISITVAIAPLVACIVLAIAVWLLMRANIGSAKLNSEPRNKRAEEPVMQAGDWINATVNVVIGVFLGVAVEGLARLMTTAFWPVAVLIPFLVAALFFFESLFDRLVDRVFPSGIRPARKPQTVRQAPLPRRLNLSAGLVLGVVLAGLPVSVGR